MSAIQIVYPLLAMVALIFLVWAYMYITRLGKMFREKIPPQALADREGTRKTMKSVAGPSENLMNLFEVPVLFFVAVLLAYITRQADVLFVGLAWAYVLFRALHSLIHCTYNNVHHRFVSYIISTIVLWVFWGRLGYLLVTKSIT